MLRKGKGFLFYCRHLETRDIATAPGCHELLRFVACPFCRAPITDSVSPVRGNGLDSLMRLKIR